MLPDKHLFGKHQSRRGSWGIGQEMYSVFQLKFSLSSLYRNPLACNSSGLTIIKQVWQQLSGGIERENPFTKWQSGGIDARDEKNRWVDGGSQNGKAPESEQQYAALPSPGTNMHTNLFCAQSRKPAHPSPSIFLRSAALKHTPRNPPPSCYKWVRGCGSCVRGDTLQGDLTHTLYGAF